CGEADRGGDRSRVAAAEARGRADAEVREIELRPDLEAEGGIGGEARAWPALVVACLGEEGEAVQDPRFHRERRVRRIDTAHLAGVLAAAEPRVDPERDALAERPHSDGGDVPAGPVDRGPRAPSGKRAAGLEGSERGPVRGVPRV